MAWATAGAIVGGSVLSGMMGSSASKRAAHQQAVASDNALNFQARMYNQSRRDAEPWRQAGIKALAGMQGSDFQKDFSMNDFQADPGYAFRMAEANKAMERSAAARGNLMSGQTLKALTQYNQDAASQEYQNAYNRFNADRDRRFNRLSSLAGTGQTAQTNTAQLGGQLGQSGANLIAGVGNAQAGATMAGAQNTANMIGQGINTWAQYNMMNNLNKKLQPAGGTMAGGSYKTYGNIA